VSDARITKLEDVYEQAARNNQARVMEMLAGYGKVIGGCNFPKPIGYQTKELAGMENFVVVREATIEEWRQAQACVPPELRLDNPFQYIYELAAD
jgi:hypothetical protein